MKSPFTLEKLEDVRETPEQEELRLLRHFYASWISFHQAKHLGKDLEQDLAQVILDAHHSIEKFRGRR